MTAAGEAGVAGADWLMACTASAAALSSIECGTDGLLASGTIRSGARDDRPRGRLSAIPPHGCPMMPPPPPPPCRICPSICSIMGRSMDPKGAASASAGRPVMNDGIGFPVKNRHASLLNVLQLCSSRL